MSNSSSHSTHTSKTSHSFAQSLASLRHSNSAGGGSGSRHRLKPASSITRQENRLGITTDYTDLSLHSAAAKGNVGEFLSQNNCLFLFQQRRGSSRTFMKELEGSMKVLVGGI